ncbi:MAG: STAS domain-containing protein [bacterium]|nr:STAS domain-containing protein [bacterium]
MEVEIKNLEKVSVISLMGRIDVSTAPQLEEEWKGLMKKGVSKVVINFIGVNYISSGGLRVLLVAAKEAKTGDKTLRLCHLDPNVYKIFKLAGFTTIFNIYETEEEALKDI